MLEIIKKTTDEWRTTYYFRKYDHDIKIHYNKDRELYAGLLEIFIHLDPKSPYWQYGVEMDFYYKPELHLEYVNVVPYNELKNLKEYIDILLRLNEEINELVEDFIDAHKKGDLSALERKHGWNGDPEGIGE